ncbi:MAG: universal stress protein [Planctomycetia bacterium]|nr:universal stress protein [Planctomycetia bacterium]
MLKRILVGLGGTEYTPSAIHRGVELALAHDAELSGVGVIDYRRLTRVGPVPLGGGHYAAELRRQRVEQARAPRIYSCGASSGRRRCTSFGTPPAVVPAQ